MFKRLADFNWKGVLYELQSCSKDSKAREVFSRQIEDSRIEILQCFESIKSYDKIFQRYF